MIVLPHPIIYSPKSVQPTEQDILLAIRQGDERAFEAVFRQYYASLCRYAHQFLPDVDDDEEEVQAMFLTLWEKRDGLFVTSSLKSYLFRAVHTRCLNHIKHIGIRKEHRQHTLYTVESPVKVLKFADRLQRAIRNLPEQCRLAFTLSRFEELKYQEIADQLGISVKTVENQIGKALRMLRTELSDYLPMVFLVLTTIKWLMTQVEWIISLAQILSPDRIHYSFVLL